jgi:hypothetical protein
VLRAFLKDNNIQADPDASTDIRALSAGLAAATEGTVSAEELQAIFDDFANNPVTMQ